MPNESATMDTVNVRTFAKLLGVSDKSMVAAVKAGKFPTATQAQSNGRNLPVYFISESDPFVKELIAAKDAKQPLPFDFVDRAESLRKAAEQRARKAQRKAEREARKSGASAAVASGSDPAAAPAAGPVLAPTPSSPPPSPLPGVQIPPAPAAEQPEIPARPIPTSTASAPTVPMRASSSTFRTNVWVANESGTPGFVTQISGGIPNPMAVKTKFGEGSFFFTVERLKNNVWVYVPESSIWPPMDPMVILPEEAEEPVQPGGASSKPVQSPSPMDMERSRDLEFFRKQAEARVADASRPRGDDGMARALSDMSRANAEAVMKGFSTTNDGVQRLVEAMREEAKARDDQHKRDMEEMRERAKADQDRIRAESEARLKEIELRAKLDSDLRKEEAARRDDAMKREWEEKLARDREWMGTITKNKDEVAAAIREAQDTKLNAVVENVNNKAEELDARFREKVEFLTQLNDLKASMQPMHLIASTIQSLGEKFSGVLGPALAQGGFGMGPGAGIGNAGQAGPKLLPNGSGGGQQMSILAKIKAAPEGMEMLKDFLISAARYARDDEPVDLFGQGVLSAVSTVPFFATALSELYKTPLADIVHGVLESGTEEYKVLMSDKGTKFWEAFRGFVKDYYKQMAEARRQPQPPVQ